MYEILHHLSGLDFYHGDAPLHPGLNIAPGHAQHCFIILFFATPCSILRPGRGGARLCLSFQPSHEVVQDFVHQQYNSETPNFGSSVPPLPYWAKGTGPTGFMEAEG